MIHFPSHSTFPSRITPLLTDGLLVTCNWLAILAGSTCKVLRSKRHYFVLLNREISRSAAV
jgi:hypothetical protein